MILIYLCSYIVHIFFNKFIVFFFYFRDKLFICLWIMGNARQIVLFTCPPKCIVILPLCLQSKQSQLLSVSWILSEEGLVWKRFLNTMWSNLQKGILLIYLKLLIILPLKHSKSWEYSYEALCLALLKFKLWTFKLLIVYYFCSWKGCFVKSWWLIVFYEDSVIYKNIWSFPQSGLL